LAVCSHLSLAPANNKVARAVELAVCCHRSQAVAATAPVVVACSDRATWTKPARVALRATGPHIKVQALRRQDTEAISNQDMVGSHLQASSREITMRTRRLTSRATRHSMPSLHSKHTVILSNSNSSSSSSSSTVKVDTGSKGTAVDTSTVKVAKVAGIERINEGSRHET
jgi:type IV secretory pathway protease TraF